MHPYESHTIALLRSADRAREARAERLVSVTGRPSPLVAAVRRAVGLRLITVGQRLAAGNVQPRTFRQRSR